MQGGSKGESSGWASRYPRASERGIRLRQTVSHRRDAPDPHYLLDGVGRGPQRPAGTIAPPVDRSVQARERSRAPRLPAVSTRSWFGSRSLAFREPGVIESCES